MPISQDNRLLIHRLGVLRIAIILVFLGFGLKLWHLMVIRSSDFIEQARRNQVRTVPLVAPRGVILDRDGKVLAENTNSMDLFLYREEANDLEQTRVFLTADLALDPELLTERLDEAAAAPPFRPALLKENLSFERVARLLSHQAEHPGLKILEQPRRLYRHASTAAHVLGYVGEISEAELELEEYEGFSPGDKVGKAGIEKRFNRHLTGEDGNSRILVNSAGKMLSELGRRNPKPGQPLTLTIDLDLQLLAEAELVEQPGAIVLFDARSGEVLVMASSPTFDPNLLATRISREDWNAIVSDPDHPFQNRGIQNAFSPGSIFKLVMALAGLESGVIDPSTSVYCNGATRLYGHVFHCWNRGGHGLVRLREAIQHSCNIYFYNLGQKLGIDQIEHFARKVGLGEPTGIDLLGEVRGLVPSQQWKRRTSGEPWYAGETISVAIGQGPLNVTPAQLARAIGTIATGRLPRLHLVKDGNGSSQNSVSMGFRQEHLDLIKDAMWQAVNEWGTGRSAQVANLDVCGKTGTAQTISSQARSALSDEDKKRFEPNAWFVGFAPRSQPEVVIAVIVQRGGGGGTGAAPIAGRILAEYQRKYLEPKATPLELASKSP